MYEFRDTTEEGSTGELPAEAMRINGQYLEDQIPGYHTLSVSGREALTAELDTVETGVRDGSRLKSRRYPARTITVQYQLVSASCAAFRDAYNRLGSILNAQNVEMVFRDEPDKYFVGTPGAIGDVDPGTNCIVGEFNILCADPFKYSLKEYTATPAAGSATAVIDYHGTYKAYPTLEVDFWNEGEIAADGTAHALTGKGDCGYVAFFAEDKKIIQLGDPDEIDAEEGVYPKSQTLINQMFRDANAWSDAARSLWRIADGTFGIQTFRVYNYNTQQETVKDYLGVSDYGSGTGWHGPTLSRDIPTDGAGETGAKNFTFTYRQKMWIGDNSLQDVNQTGRFQAQLMDNDGAQVAAIQIIKTTPGYQAELQYWIRGQKVYQYTIDLDWVNAVQESTDYGYVSVIQKSGSTVSFEQAGYLEKVFQDAAVADKKVTKIEFAFLQYGETPVLSYHGLELVKFVKDNCETARNIPNKFSANDVLIADCRDCTVKLNGSPAPELGALGNNWEGFVLKPGLNQIGVSYSAWVPADYAPTCKIRYREVYL